MWFLIIVGALLVLVAGGAWFLSRGEYAQMRQRQQDHARRRARGEFHGQRESDVNPDVLRGHGGGSGIG